MRALLMLVLLAGCGASGFRPFEPQQTCTWDGAGGALGVVYFEGPRDCERVRAGLSHARDEALTYLQLTPEHFEDLYRNVEVWVHEEWDLDHLVDKSKYGYGESVHIVGLYNEPHQRIQLSHDMQGLGHEMMHHYEAVELGTPSAQRSAHLNWQEGAPTAEAFNSLWYDVAHDMMARFD